MTNIPALLNSPPPTTPHTHTGHGCHSAIQQSCYRTSSSRAVVSDPAVWSPWDWGMWFLLFLFPEIVSFSSGHIKRLKLNKPEASCLFETMMLNFNEIFRSPSERVAPCLTGPVIPAALSHLAFCITDLSQKMFPRGSVDSAGGSSSPARGPVTPVTCS